MSECQYPNCRQEAQDGYQFCLFHAPQDGKLGFSLEDFNTQIRGRLSRPKTDFVGYVFPGEISLSEITIPNGARFTEAVFHGPVDFSRATFSGRVTFDKAIFHGLASFPGAKFMGRASFKDVTFLDGAVFSGAHFMGPADFGKASFSLKPDTERLLIECIKCNDTEFVGGAIFSDCHFEKGFVDFRNAKFGGLETDFRYSKFFDEKANIIFTDCEFGASRTMFHGARLNANDISFFRAKFPYGDALFQECKFMCNQLSFIEVDFTGGQANFYGVKFVVGETKFANCRIEKSYISFYNALFRGGFAKFSNLEIAGDFEFKSVKIETAVSFKNLQFGEKSNFYFINPQFGNSLDVPGIIFGQIRFNPFKTFFQGIKSGIDFDTSAILKKPLVLFRYCYLKDVYFAECEMDIFSFYTSTFFEEAHFISGTWLRDRERIFRWLPLKKYKRKYKILDEALLGLRTKANLVGVDEKRKEWLEAQGLPEHHWDVINLYIQMKTAADRMKSYQKASWFYFNEIELKRRLLIREIAAKAWPKRIFKYASCLRLHLYNSYKLLAGYGEKPFWSLTWFLIAVIVFGIAHLFNGFKTPIRTINYNLAAHLPSIGRLVEDLGFALLFALYRLVPVYFLPFDRTSFALVS